MSAVSSRKISTRVRLFSLFSLLLVIAVVVVTIPRASNANRAASTTSGKRTRPAFVPGEAIVRYKNENIAQTQTAATTLNVDGRGVPMQIKGINGLEIVPGLRVAQMAPEDTLAAIEALNKQPDVLYAEPNYLLYPDAVPNDTRFSELWSLQNTGQAVDNPPVAGTPNADIDVTPVWNTTTGSSSIVVGVIDEGIDRTHQDLSANIWINPGEIAGNGIDDDGNGFVDDVNGYNFAANTGTFPAENHATHVAGTIGAQGNNGLGVAGINWTVRLMSLKFIDGPFGDTLDAIRATNYAKQMKDLWESSGHTKGANVRVLNNSYGGGGFDQSFMDAITRAGQSGILFVAAAGNAPDSPEPNNDLVPHYPGSYNAPNVIAVAATTSSDTLASFSHYGGNTVQIGAPGSSILSTTVANTYSFFSGTSMATPQVSGAAALMLAQNPNLSVQQLRSLLIFNGDLIPALAGTTLTGRRLDVDNSFSAANEGDTIAPGTVGSFHINSQTGRSLNIGWIASGDDGAVGQASLYQLSFTDAVTGAVINLKNIIPATPGASQSIDVTLPYRHTNGTLTLREFDNVGNQGVPATFAVTVSQIAGDPYITQVGSPTSLTSGGMPLSLIGDDKLYSAAHAGNGFTLPFSFPFFGQNYSSVDISTNGNLYFSTPPTRSNGDADDVPSSTVALEEFKMISGMWDDLRTDGRTGDDVYVGSPDATRIIFRWQGEIFGDGTNPANQPQVNFEIELRSNGTIITRYGNGNTQIFPVVGIGAGEPDAYVIPTHTSETTPISLTNAQTVTFTPRTLSINSNAEFSQALFNTSESSASVIVNVTRSGDTSSQASVDFVTVDGSATQKGDYLFASGRLVFAPGEITKSITVLIVNDVFVEGTENFSLSLSNPIGTTIGFQNITSVSIGDNDVTTPTTNPLDNADARFFVRQHYLDFLNREPDAPGLAFWTNEITQCGTNAACIDLKRSNVSAAFFLSIEFQETGYLVYRMYKAAYGNLTTPAGAPVPIRYQEFLPDTQQVALGVVVGPGDWQTKLEANKTAFALDFVSQARFTTAYPVTLTPAQFVDMLFGHAGITPSASERSSIIGEFGTAINTTNIGARARALRRVAENDALRVQELNKAFVLMQYFGYLRRNPYDPPEIGLDYGGFNFWLGKLLQFNGNYITAEMVRSFLVSTEYRARFGPTN